MKLHKPKYRYNTQSGLVYRQLMNGSWEFLRPADGLWYSSTNQHDGLNFTSKLTPISSSVVSYFIHSEGYLQFFRTREI